MYRILGWTKLGVPQKLISTRYKKMAVYPLQSEAQRHLVDGLIGAISLFRPIKQFHSSNLINPPTVCPITKQKTVL